MNHLAVRSAMSLVSLNPFNMTAPTFCWAPSVSIIQTEKLFNGGAPVHLPGLKKYTPLKKIVERIAEGYENEIKHALYKDKGYFSRLFSSESWDDWTEKRTALGQVVALIQDYQENPSKQLIKRMKPLLAQANREAQSCTLSLAGGALGSALTKNPLPMIWAVSECWMKVYAAPVLIKPIPDYQSVWNNVDFQFSDDTFEDPDGEILTYSAKLTNGKSLPHYLKFDGSTRTFSGGVNTQTLNIKVTAKDPQNEEAYAEFDIFPDSRMLMAIFIPIFTIPPLAVGGYLYYKGACCERRREYYSIN